ncbi:MAG TPA: CNNM domain-containing protein [Candidatus Limnocylindria bacterium]|nr:CNNM domain-containing protein [Candidatus Limnocylindria bacterium]
MDQTALELLLLELAIVLVLAVLSASEAAIHAIRRPHLLEELAGRGRRGRRVGALGQRSVNYLAAIQVMEFFAIFAFAGVAAAGIAPRLSVYLQLFGIDARLGDVTAVVVTVAALSLFAVLFGIFVPRALGARYAQPMLLILVWPIQLITWLTRPLVALLFLLTRAITRPFGAHPLAGTLVSEEEIKALVETGEEQGVLEETERDMIRSIFDLGDKQVHELMVPRTEIVAVDVSTRPEDLLERVVLVGHSRIPIYEGSADQIIGVLYVKDVFRRIARGQGSPPLRELLRPAHFVPETKKVDELLREMQQQKNHMAIVVDEYGGTAGLVTLEDIVEEIVGEIRDEYDVEQELVVPVSEREALVDGRAPFEDVRETFALEDLDASADYDTVGGFIVHALGRFPKAGEEVRRSGVRFVVETVEGRRIRRVRVVREPAPVPEGVK